MSLKGILEGAGLVHRLLHHLVQPLLLELFGEHPEWLPHLTQRRKEGSSKEPAGSVAGGPSGSSQKEGGRAAGSSGIVSTVPAQRPSSSPVTSPG
jgi:hypothetical protein